MTTNASKTTAKSPSILQLLAKAEELGVTDRKEARALIKRFKVKTFKKLEAVASKHASPVPGARSVDRAKANAILRSARNIEGKLRGQAVKTPGPRGYRIGPVWLKSIVEGKGIALHPSNLPKLLCTAAAKGIELPKGALSQPDIAAHLAKHLEHPDAMRA